MGAAYRPQRLAKAQQKVKLPGSNLSEKPPFIIGGWGLNDMARGSKGTGQGWLGVTGILDCNAEFNGTIGSQHPEHLHPPGERWPSPGEGLRQRGRERQWEGRGTQGGKPPTLLREGYPHYGGNSMHRLSDLQLDNAQCMQTLRSETAPGATRTETDTTVPARLHHLPALWHPLAYPTPVLPKGPPARPMERKRTRPS